MATGEGLHLTLIDVCAELLLQIRRRNMLSCGSRSRNFDLGGDGVDLGYLGRSRVHHTTTEY